MEQPGVQRVTGWLRQMRIGIAFTLLIVGGTWAFVETQGPLYDVWGWPELVLGTLVLAVFAFAGLEALFRQPNPYGRSNPGYELRDISPQRDLDSGGSGWLIQAIPMVATALLLSTVFILT